MNDTTKVQRPGREFWDKLNALPRYMFLLKPSDVGIQKLEDSTGNWIDVHEAQKVVDQAQDRIGELQEAYVAAGEREHVLREEREALQQRLTTADQRIDDLETQLDGAQDQLGAAWDALHAVGINSPGTLSVAEGIALLLAKLAATEQRNAELINCAEELADLVEASIEGGYKADSFTTQPIRNALAALKPTEAVLIAAGLGYPLSKEDAVKTYKATLQPRTDHPNNEDCEWCHGCGHDYYGEPCVGCCKPAVQRQRPPAAEACQFPQSCTTRCDCDIPDFSPGNGNKARRRAAAIVAMRPENQQVTPLAIDDPLTICLGCFGSGTVSTGITEASSTVCNGCNGTGREQA